MTQPAPSPSVQSPLPQGGLPSIRQDLRLIPAAPGRDGSPAWSLYDPMRNQYFRMGQKALAILDRWRPGETAQKLAETLGQAGQDIDAVVVEEFAGFLKKSHLTAATGPEDVRQLAALKTGRRTGALKWLLKNYLYIRLPLLRPDPLLERTLPWVSFLFSPWARRIITALGITGLFLTLRQWEAFLGTFQHFFDAGGLATFALTLFAVKAFHELGHAYSAKRQGCRVPTMGVAFLVLYPMLYTDTTDAWRLPSHRQRLNIALAGIRVELALAMLATFAWNVLPDGSLRSAAFFVATVGWVGSLALNLSPFMRFDGYYALADWLEAENLQSRAFALARWQMREWLFGFGASPPEALSRRRKWIFIFYAWGTWIYRLFLFLGIALLVYHAAFKALGIVLFGVEIGWFLLLPVWREIRLWWQGRRRVRFSPGRLVAPLFLAAALGALLVPWQHQTALVGVLKADRFVPVYPRESGRIEAVEIQREQWVVKGEPLIRLASPDLVAHRAQLTVRIALLRTLMDRHSASAEDLSRLSVLQQQMAEALSDLEGLDKRASRLVIRAPFGGKAALFGALHPGQWLSRETPVATLFARRGSRLEAYVDEENLHRIAAGSAGRFLAQDGQHPWLAATVADVDHTAVTHLAEPMLASVYGGPIAVRRMENGTLRPEKALYRIRLNTAQTLLPPPHPLPGTVRIQGRSASVAGRFWRHALAVLIRESGF